MKKINSLLEQIEDTENDLTLTINSLGTKKEREELLAKSRLEMDKINKTFDSLFKSNKKQRNKHVQKNGRKKLEECKNKIGDLKIWYETQVNDTKTFKDIPKIEYKSKHPGYSQIQERRNESRTRSIIGGPSNSNLNMLQKEDETFQKGVNTTKNILKNVKLMNMKLDDISDLVRLQRQKLLNMHKQIEQSQNYMNQTKTIMRGFSKELYGDTIIFSLVGLITLILIFIMIASIKYKLKSDILIGNDGDGVISQADFSLINSKIFWKTTYVNEKSKDVVKKYFPGEKLFINYIINSKLKEIDEELYGVDINQDDLQAISLLMDEATVGTEAFIKKKNREANIKAQKSVLSSDGIEKKVEKENKPLDNIIPKDNNPEINNKETDISKNNTTDNSIQVESNKDVIQENNVESNTIKAKDSLI